MYAVRFPDMPSVMTFAFSRSHALEMAFESNGVLRGKGGGKKSRAGEYQPPALKTGGRRLFVSAPP